MDKLQPESAAALAELQNTLRLAENYAESDDPKADNLLVHMDAITEDLDILLACKASDAEVAKSCVIVERTARRLRRDLQCLINDTKRKENEEDMSQSVTYIPPQQQSLIAPNDNADTEHTPGASMRLPTCKLPVFSGDPAKFSTFHDTYCQLVLNNPAIPLSAKWLYLYDSLEGNPLTMVKRLPQRTGLSVALQMLRQTYQSDGKVISNTYFEIQFLPPAEDTEESLRMTHAQLEGLILTLDELKHDTEQNEFLRMVYIGKFPAEMIARTVDADELPFSEIRKRFNAIIVAREKAVRQRVNQACLTAIRKLMLADTKDPTQIAQLAALSAQQTKQAETKTQLNKVVAPSNRSPTKRTPRMPLQCFFCPDRHWPDECKKVTTASERAKLIPDRCPKCVRIAHPGLACAVNRRCTYCASTEHNRALCPKQFPDSTQTLLLRNTDDRPQNNGTFWTLLAQVSAKSALHGAELRIMLDPGSARSFITASAAKKLRLPISTKNMTHVTSAGDTHVGTLPAAEGTITLSTPAGIVENIHVFVIPKIIDNVPAANIDQFRQAYPHLQNLYIPETGDGRPIELLLGNDCLVAILELEKSIKIDESQQLLATKLGWILIRNCLTKDTPQVSVFALVTDEDVKQMWDLENIGLKYVEQSETEDEEKAIESFYSTIKYKQNRYEVTWPWKETPPALNDNFGQSFGRLKSLYRQLQNKPQLMRDYNEIINQQIKDSIVEEVKEHSQASIIRYIPHHPIICPEKSTKMRLVYDASAKCGKNEKSLNDCLFKGKKWIDDLPAMLMKFRQNGTAVAADIEKAYHQIGIAPNDRDAVRFLWLLDINAPPTASNLRFLRFRRMAFGIVSSPFLLYATITHHLRKQKTENAEITSHNMYADNLVVSLPSDVIPTEFYNDVKNIFSTMSMNLTKWATNDSDLRAHIPTEDQNTEKEQGLLGMRWRPIEDTLSLKKPKNIPMIRSMTKRIVLAQLAAVFDPLGWAAPLTLRAKLYIRDLWKNQNKWDQQLSEQQTADWQTITDELNKVTEIRLPRQMFTSGTSGGVLRLHVFSDASAVAIAVVVYIERSTQHCHELAFVAAKTKLAPKTKLSIPRLELLAAVIAARFVTYLRSAVFQSENLQAILWCDSKCVLSWITSEKIKPNVIEKQTEEIRTAKLKEHRYVPSEMNPADIASRGATLQQLKDLKWWSNPQWLLCAAAWPTQPPMNEEITAHEDKLLLIVERMPEKQQTIDRYHEGLMGIDESKFSSLNRLLRITVRCFVAVNKLTHRNLIDVEEDAVRTARQKWVQNDQMRFYTHYDKLKTTETKSINNLRVYRDLEGIIRVHTRLQHTELENETVAPILLMNGTHLTRLIIMHTHAQNKHVGAPQTLAILRKIYSLPKGRREVAAVIRAHCYVCRRYIVQTCSNPPPAPLPEFRVKRGTRPFAGTGMDILGPFSIKDTRMKDSPRSKRWIVIFTCTTVRAVHLEVINNMTTVEIVDALRRFVARRGAPDVILCDNAPQFHALDGRFSNLWREVRKHNEFNDYLVNKDITFKFVPQESPWMGGVYERLIRDVKMAMERTYGTVVLTDQQFVTSICEVEAVLNERPLTYIESGQENTILTPNHFLAARFTAIELKDPTGTHEDQIVKLWRTARAYLETFWTLWSSYYLLMLRERDDKLKDRRTGARGSFDVGEIVLIAESEKRRSSWRLAKVIRLIKSTDGVVRSVLLQLSTGVKLIRPIIKIAPMGIQSDESSVPPVELSHNRQNITLLPPEGASNDHDDANPEIEIITVFPDKEDTVEPTQ